MVSRDSPVSIQLRLLAAALLILPLFLGLTAWSLDRAFASYQQDAQSERMRLLQLILARETEWDGEQWVVASLDEPRLGLLNSGLYALLLDPGGDVLWSSPSAEQIGDLAEPGRRVSEIASRLRLLDTALGERRLLACELGEPHFCQATRIAWGSRGPESLMIIVESQTEVLAARAAYQNNLILLSLGAALLLLLAQALVIRWGLRPLRAIAHAVEGLQRGEQDHLEGQFPPELTPLTRNINLLIDSEKRRRERVRNTMDRLAHVLKSPLQLIRNSDPSDENYQGVVQEQVDRMLGVVESGLTRARLDGRAPDILGQPVPVRPVLERIAEAYGRLPRPGSATPMSLDTSGVEERACFLGEEPDLQDLFGSILENSIRHCRARVQVDAAIETEAEQGWLVLRVGDDGDGIPGGQASEVLKRGARADTASFGHGLGLSIVVEIASAYRGSVHVGESSLGGAEFIVRLPGSSAA